MNLKNLLNLQKTIFLKKNNIFAILLVLLIFIFDRFTKINIINNYSDNVFFISDFVNLDLIWNTGIGFGLLSVDSSFIYNLISVFIGLIILILFYVALISKTKDKLIFSVIIGGAIGNFYDRAIYKAVPDFIDVHYGNLHWFTFNTADIFITMGVLIFLFKRTERKK